MPSSRRPTASTEAARAGDAAAGYSRLTVWLHWIIASLVIANIAIGLSRDELPDEAMELHFSFGASVLALTLVALAWRIAHPRPPHPDLHGWERALARLVHTVFWALLIVLPLTGWLYHSTEDGGESFGWFGLIEVSPLPVGGDNDDLHDAVEDVHVALGRTMGVLAILHVLGALKHHFVDRNDVLRRMLPRFAR